MDARPASTAAAARGASLVFPNQYRNPTNAILSRTTTTTTAPKPNHSRRHDLGGMSSGLHDALAHSGLSTNTNTNTNNTNNHHHNSSNMSTPQPSLLQRVPMHMSKNTTNNTKTTTNHDPSNKNPYRTTNLTNTNSLGTTHPYTNKKHTTASSTKCQPRYEPNVVSLDSLLSNHHTKTKRTATTMTSSKPPVRKLARFEDFDGAVPRPKPNILFRTVASPYATANTTTTAECNDVTDQAKDDILDRQRQLANAILSKNPTKNKNKNNNKNNNVFLSSKVATATAKTFSLTGKQQQKQHPITTNNNNQKTRIRNTAVSAMNECGLFGTSTIMTQEEKNRILSTDSQFVTEVQAEQYVKNRKAVMALERQEDIKTFQQTNKNKNKNNNNSSSSSSSPKKESRIVTEWKCITCQKVHRTKPKLCIAYNHKIVIQRTIQKKLTAAESRLKQKDVDQGGMILGAGLEWSGYKYQSIS